MRGGSEAIERSSRRTSVPRRSPPDLANQTAGEGEGRQTVLKSSAGRAATAARNESGRTTNTPAVDERERPDM